jgi:hypothetical protein
MPGFHVLPSLLPLAGNAAVATSLIREWPSLIRWPGGQIEGIVMSVYPTRRVALSRPETWAKGRAGLLTAALLLGTLFAAELGWGSDQTRSPDILYYSTAEVPRDYRGPVPIVLALNEATSKPFHRERPVDREVLPARAPANDETPPPAPSRAERSEVPRVASAASRLSLPAIPKEPERRPAPRPTPPPSIAAPDPIAQALQAIADCRTRFASVQDYTCIFHKRERIGGRLSSPHIMMMKCRTNPNSIYFKFYQPNKGREAIYVAGRNHGKVVAHDVGIGKLLAGTMHLDPRGSMAMEDNRHPVTEAGIGPLIETVARHWANELSPEESRLTFHENVRVGNHPCKVIDSVHPRKRPDFLYYMVKLYIDHDLGIPIRFEAYDWPKHPGAAPELVEEYTYMNVRLNVGLRDRDFDPSNPQYAFGRF